MNKGLMVSNKSGQSIIEVLIAFAVTVVLGIALISAGLVTQRASISARNNSQATKLAQAYLEQVRVIRDVKGYTVFNGYSGPPTCFTVGNDSSSDPSTWNLTTPCPDSSGAPNNLTGQKVMFNSVDFYRKVTLGSPSATARDVTVTVAWVEGTNVRDVVAATVLSKWCEGQITGTGTPCS